LKKIKVIVPVNTSIWNESILEIFEKNKDSDTLIDIVNITKGPEAIEQHYDEVWAELFTLREAEKAEEEGYDGIIIYCFGDPAVRAAKEKLSIPVIGIMEASIHFASLLGKRFSIITTRNEGKFATEDLLKLYGFEKKCVSIRALGIEVLNLVDRSRLRKAALETCRLAVEDDGADVLVFGCGSILGLREEISEILKLPVIEPGITALKICEDLIDVGLTHSKRAYPMPLNIKRQI